VTAHDDDSETQGLAVDSTYLKAPERNFRGFFFSPKPVLSRAVTVGVVGADVIRNRSSICSSLIWFTSSVRPEQRGTSMSKGAQRGAVDK